MLVIHLLLSHNLNMFMKSSHWKFGIHHHWVQTAHGYWKHWQRAIPFLHNQLQGNTFCCLQANTWYCLLPSIETWPISFKIALIKTRSYNTCEIVFPNTSQEWAWPSDSSVTSITLPLPNKYKPSYILFYANISKATASQKIYSCGKKWLRVWPLTGMQVTGEDTIKIE